MSIKLTIQRQIGVRRYGFTFDGKDLWEVLMASQEVAFNDVEKCGLCGGKWLALRAYETKEDKYQYIKIECRDPKCWASVTLGKRKDNGAFFLRKTAEGKVEWELPKKDAAGKPMPQSPAPVNPPPRPGEDLGADLGEPAF